jgi:hypothetical protein
MRTVVVYESMYANTHRVAEAIAEGLREADGGEVALCTVTQANADALAGAELVVVGGPTHMHGMTSTRSRKMAAEAAAKSGEEIDPSAEGPGLRAWFQDVPKPAGVKGAAFDTRLPGPMLMTGSAAKGIARRLKRHGYDLVAEPQSFVVKEAEGPLEDGELERARAWGASLATGAAAAPVGQEASA